MDNNLKQIKDIEVLKELAIRSLNIDPLERINRIREIREKVRRQFEEIKGGTKEELKNSGIGLSTIKT